MEQEKIFKLELKKIDYKASKVEVNFITEGMSKEEISEGLILFFEDNKHIAPLFLAAIEYAKNKVE